MDFWKKQEQDEQRRVKELHAKAAKMPDKHYSPRQETCWRTNSNGQRFRIC